MSFIKKNCNRTPIVDTVFAIEKLAKADPKKNTLINATIGALYDESKQLVAMKSVFQSFNAIDDAKKAAYAESFVGNHAFLTQVYKWIIQNNSTLKHSVIATPGGSGAIAISVMELLDEAQTILIPEIAWGSYALMAQMNNVKVETYPLFEKEHFAMNAFQKKCETIMHQQKKLFVIINDPCHNPTGYSLTKNEWQQIVEILNQCSKKGPVILVNDVAYIDFAFSDDAKAYVSTFEAFNEQVLSILAFSTSKSMTSYGMRCGAAIMLCKQEEALREVEIQFEKSARSIWSNVNNAAMENFVNVMEKNREAYLKEKAKYIKLLKQRSEHFIQDASTCNLLLYPYIEGFFITLKMQDNKMRDAYHQALIKNHIYTVKVNKGIRIAICSLTIDQCTNLASKLKTILDALS